MIRPKRLFSACLLWPLANPTPASALAVEIQGTRLEIQIAGASCVEIAGSYPGVRIEPSQNGKSPRICYNSNKVNSITILDSTFIAAEPAQKDISLRFEHDFPPGINGKIMARAKLQGFFSTTDGVGIPSGDKLSLSAFFSQSGHDDAIAEAFNLTVGDDMESALFDYSAKEQYLIAGPRKLKGVLTMYFTQVGHKLTLGERSGILLDTGSTMADKLETMESEPTEPTEESAEPTAADDAPKEPKLVPTVPPKESKSATTAPSKGPKPAAPETPPPDLPGDLPTDTLPFTAPPTTGNQP